MTYYNTGAKNIHNATIILFLNEAKDEANNCETLKKGTLKLRV